MKFLVFFLLCASSALVCTAQTQNTEFVEYLLKLQYATQSYYDSMMLTYRDAREALSNYLTKLNSAAVTEVTEGLRAVISIRDASQAAIDEANGSEQCVQNAVANFEDALTNVGQAISDCVVETTTQMETAAENFHEYIQQQSTISFEVQNLILNAFTQVNPITEEAKITPWISEEIDKVYTSFNYEVIPELMKLLDVLGKLFESAPIEINTCINAATERFEDEAAVLSNTLELC